MKAVTYYNGSTYLQDPDKAPAEYTVGVYREDATVGQIQEDLEAFLAEKEDGGFRPSLEVNGRRVYTLNELAKHANRELGMTANEVRAALRHPDKRVRLVAVNSPEVVEDYRAHVGRRPNRTNEWASIVRTSIRRGGVE